MKNRYRCFLRSTTNKSATGRHMINLPNEILEEMEWGINEHLIIDIIKNGINRNLIITVEGKR